MDVTPVDFSSDIGKVRALIPDVEQVDFDSTGTAAYLFSDQHLGAFLSLHDTDPDIPSLHILRAAADACEAVGMSEALVSKVVKTEDLQTDGAKVAGVFLQRARALRQEAERQEQDLGQAAFTIVDFQPQPPETLPYSWRGFPAGLFPWAHTGPGV